jgi:hypothetical protein
MSEVEVTSLDPSALDRVLDRLETAVHTFGSGVDRLTTTAGQLTGCWGTDQFGSSFAQNYVPTAGKALDQSTGAVPDLLTTVSNLRQVNTMFQKMDGDGPLVLNGD